ncbi:hypothetical protein Nepgr_005643 [Nepenthes gracilis]|uniref:Uncharacterized protein n=1 Tax=Nepenthes gracilis TaxID=150966 RepID=A0AAD3S3Z2_NEPGR|nr:hypothetical protein Nepgr_005643 [Nepenthes gracilis]
MTGMRKSIGEPTIPSVFTAPGVQVIEEVARLTSSVQIPEINVRLELAIFSGLPTLSEIFIEPRIEEALGAVVISDSTKSARLQDRIQEVAPTFEASSEHVVYPSIDPAKIRPQPDVNPPRLEKEIHCPEISTSNPIDVQERIRPDWMNIPASFSHPSPGSHLDRVSTSVLKISLNEIALNARFFQASIR